MEVEEVRIKSGKFIYYVSVEGNFSEGCVG